MKISDKIVEVKPRKIKNKEGKEYDAFQCKTAKGYDFLSFQALADGDIVALEVQTKLICKIDF